MRGNFWSSFCSYDSSELKGSPSQGRGNRVVRVLHHELAFHGVNMCLSGRMRPLPFAQVVLRRPPRLQPCDRLWEGAGRVEKSAPSSRHAADQRTTLLTYRRDVVPLFLLPPPPATTAPHALARPGDDPVRPSTLLHRASPRPGPAPPTGSRARRATAPPSCPGSRRRSPRSRSCCWRAPAPATSHGARAASSAGRSESRPAPRPRLRPPARLVRQPPSRRSAWRWCARPLPRRRPQRSGAWRGAPPADRSGLTPAGLHPTRPLAPTGDRSFPRPLALVQRRGAPAGRKPAGRSVRFAPLCQRAHPPPGRFVFAPRR